MDILEFIPIKPWVARASTARESYAAHSRLDARLSEAAGVVDNTAALDAAVDVLDAHAATGNASIGGLLAAREGSTAGLADWHDNLDLVERERQDAQILEQPTARG
jgi:hypothetical protein